MNQSNVECGRLAQVETGGDHGTSVQQWVHEASPEAVESAFNRLFLLSPDEAQRIPCLPPLGDWSGNHISSAFGMRKHPTLRSVRHHDGIDLAGPHQYVRSAAAGRVVATGRSTSLGQYVRIDHGNSYQTVYGHLALTTVKPGQWIRLGERLGITGRSGRATGVHLHYSVLKQGVAVNPAPYLTLAIRFVAYYRQQNQSTLIP
ncbi:murein DD-endopeptidase MepM/ murein hydrolase activator NlpD [Spirosoma lacussanchae]|uniref:M23 family metallopeptidase n=1 Tax=Spirosoma lacussanchae TaxID=1884249 RepID=UPI001107A6EC|nr:M23 family metallopeptidase [Spirosoma lacussanchae]